MTASTVASTVPILGSGISAGEWSLIVSVMMGIFALIGIWLKHWLSEKAQCKVEKRLKYREFCELYVKDMHEVILFLHQNGPYEGILKNAYELFNLRKQWILSIPKNINEVLDRFEKKLISIGSKSHYTNMTQNTINAPARNEQVMKMYLETGEILGWTKTLDDQPIAPSELSYMNIIALLSRRQN